MKKYKFRKAVTDDTDRCWEIIQQARRRMAECLRDQWQGEYPSLKNVVSDIALGIGYVLCMDDIPVAYGAVVTTGEPAYDVIDGHWISDNEPFVVLHRLCIANEFLGQGLAKQFFKAVEQWAAEQDIKFFRVDTNYDNVEMLHILPSIGFDYCGEITFEGGSRKAFEKAIGQY